jgi:hypothetical protein
VTRRSFLERELAEARSTFEAVGPDDEVRVWAASGALTPAEHAAWLASARGSLPHRLLVALIVAGVVDVQELRQRLMAAHEAIVEQPYEDGEEPPMLGGEAVELRAWWAACELVLLDGLSDSEERLARVADAEFQRRLTDSYLADVAEAGRPSDIGLGEALRPIFEGLRVRSLDPDAFERAKGLLALRWGADAADEAMDVLTERFLVSGGVERALLKLPAVANYLKTTAGHAGAGRDAEISWDIVRVESHDEGPEGLAVARDLERAISEEFLPSLPRRMREDFIEVRLKQRKAAELARATGRSQAAVSKNLDKADRRVRKFLADRG